MPTRDEPRLDESRLADLCLSHLAENPDELARFMDIAGYTPDSLRKAINSRELALGMIDYVAANEALMLAVCANAGITPEAFMRVWHKLNPSG